ncbi:hypothetical protein DAMA08_045760 [Martiniozyma asiatica (nom. inval.)]|nr:hypothetical protein DAMA08_045760 [Martiniozyma asiatica]
MSLALLQSRSRLRPYQLKNLPPLFSIEYLNYLAFTIKWCTQLLIGPTGTPQRILIKPTIEEAKSLADVSNFEDYRVHSPSHYMLLIYSQDPLVDEEIKQYVKSISDADDGNSDEDANNSDSDSDSSSSSNIHRNTSQSRGAGEFDPHFETADFENVSELLLILYNIATKLMSVVRINHSEQNLNFKEKEVILLAQLSQLVATFDGNLKWTSDGSWKSLDPKWSKKLTNARNWCRDTFLKSELLVGETRTRLWKKYPDAYTKQSINKNYLDLLKFESERISKRANNKNKENYAGHPFALWEENGQLVLQYLIHNEPIDQFKLEKNFTIWSCSEQEIFFNCLKRYSIHLVDAFSDQLPHKATEQIKALYDYFKKHKNDAVKTGQLQNRIDFFKSEEPALEMSDQWIQFENENADKIMRDGDRVFLNMSKWDYSKAVENEKRQILENVINDSKSINDKLPQFAFSASNEIVHEESGVKIVNSENNILSETSASQLNLKSSDLFIPLHSNHIFNVLYRIHGKQLWDSQREDDQIEFDDHFEVDEDIAQEIANYAEPYLRLLLHTLIRQKSASFLNVKDRLNYMDEFPDDPISIDKLDVYKAVQAMPPMPQLMSGNLINSFVDEIKEKGDDKINYDLVMPQSISNKSMYIFFLLRGYLDEYTNSLYTDHPFKSARSELKDILAMNVANKKKCGKSTGKTVDDDHEEFTGRGEVKEYMCNPTKISTRWDQFWQDDDHGNELVDKDISMNDKIEVKGEPSASGLPLKRTFDDCDDDSTDVSCESSYESDVSEIIQLSAKKQRTQSFDSNSSAREDYHDGDDHEGDGGDDIIEKQDIDRSIRSEYVLLTHMSEYESLNDKDFAKAAYLMGSTDSGLDILADKYKRSIIN